jgi:hypothetical protein
MIKPVYFGKSKDDILLFNYINELDNFNFSDWVKDKIKEKMKDNQIEMVGVIDTANTINTKNIEILIRKILKEEKIIDRGEESGGGERAGDKIDETISKNKITKTIEDVSVDGWVL